MFFVLCLCYCGFKGAASGGTRWGFPLLLLLDVGEDGDWLKQGAMFMPLDREYFVIWCNIEAIVSVYG